MPLFAATRLLLGFQSFASAQGLARQPLFTANYLTTGYRRALSGNYLYSNLHSHRILTSSVGLSAFTTVARRAFCQFPRKLARSQTWSNYNRHYKNDPWNRLKKLRLQALFTAAFCVGSTVLITGLFQYTPLKALNRSPNLLIYSIIALNGAVFIMWKAPQFSRFLTRYGLIVKDNVYSNWSLLGSAFSHQSVGHIMVNMFVLHSFGTSLCAMIGVSNFLIMYLNSAVVSSFVSMLIPTLMRQSMSVASLGASGAIFSVFGTFSYLIPKAPIALFFIPIPGGAWIVFLGSIAYNVAGSFLRWGTHDYAAHLGGCAAGVAYGWWYKRKINDAYRSRRRVDRF